jgi:Ran GTPase-activating protein (RanGAP) involved in mRNA processing and transport
MFFASYYRTGTLICVTDPRLQQGMEALSASLRVSSHLHCIDLSSNQLGNSAMSTLGQSLAVNFTLQDLDLGNNAVGHAESYTLSRIPCIQTLTYCRHLCETTCARSRSNRTADAV